MQQKMTDARREDGQIVQQRDWQLMDTAKAKDFEVSSANTANQNDLMKMAIQQKYALEQMKYGSSLGGSGGGSGSGGSTLSDANVMRGSDYLTRNNYQGKSFSNPDSAIALLVSQQGLTEAEARAAVQDAVSRIDGNGDMKYANGKIAWKEGHPEKNPYPQYTEIKQVGSNRVARRENPKWRQWEDQNNK